MVVENTTVFQNAELTKNIFHCVFSVVSPQHGPGAMSEYPTAGGL